MIIEIIKKSLRGGIFLISIATATPTNVYSQEDNRSLSLEEIIVTARKTEESIQQTSISITAFDTDSLEKIGAFEANAVARYTPNVLINKQPSSQDNFGYSIRGIGSGETSLAVEPTVGLYMDGVYIARSTGSAFDIASLERIEILRGPQGTLFGRNTIGGAINIITQKPQANAAAKQMFSTGNNDYLRYSTTIDSGSINNIATKIVYMHSEKGGLLENAYTGGELGQNDSDTYRLTLQWTPTQTFTANYAFYQSNKENNAALSQLVQVRPGHVNIGGTIYQQAQQAATASRQNKLFIASSHDNDSTSDIVGNALTLESEVNENTLFKSITSYREWDSTADNTDFGSFSSDGKSVLDGKGGYIPAGQLVSLFSAQRVSSQQQFTQEFQLIGDLFNESLQYNIGLFYFEEQAKENNPQSFVLPASFAFGQMKPGPVSGNFPNNPEDFQTQAFLCADPFATQGVIDTDGDTIADFALACANKDVVLEAPVFVYTTNNQSLAIYSELTYTLNSDLELTLGLRYTQDKKSATLTSGSMARIFDINTLNASKHYNNFTPGITLAYQLNERVHTYVKMASGYRAGGYNTRATTPSSFTNPVDEETLTSQEFGLKSDWFDHSLRVNAAAFMMHYKNRQVPQFEAGSNGASSRITNAGESTTKGVEFEISWLPVQGLMVQFNYGYIENLYDEFVTGLINPSTGLPVTNSAEAASLGIQVPQNYLEGSPVEADLSKIATVPFAPKQSGSFAIEYTMEPHPIGQLSIRIDTSYVDESTFHPQTNLYDSIDDYWLLNARLALTDIPISSNGNLKIAAWGKNLDNQTYREWGIDFGTLGFSTSTFGEPRSYGLDITYQYDH